MKKLVVRKAGSGKTSSKVIPAIKNYQGKIVLINSIDSRKTMEINDFQCIDVKSENIPEEFSKMLLLITEEDHYLQTEKIMNFLLDMEDERFLIVWEDAEMTLSDYLPLYLSKMRDFTADVMVVCQDLFLDFNKLFNLPDMSKESLESIISKFISGWDIVRC